MDIMDISCANNHNMTKKPINPNRCDTHPWLTPSTNCWEPQNFKSPFEIGGEKEMGICLIAPKGDQFPMGPQLPNGTTTVTLLVARCSNLRVPPQLQRHFHEECAQSHINICHDRREVLQLVGNVTNLMIQKKRCQPPSNFTSWN